MSTINFNDGIFAQEALQAFVANAPFLSLFSHSYNAEAASKGNAIYVPRVDAVTTTTFAYADNSGFPYEQSGGTINTITVNLDQQFISPVDITDLQAANSSAAEITTFAKQQGKALAKKAWQGIASLFTTANFGTAVGAFPLLTFGYTYSVGVSIRTAMVKRDVPIDDLTFVVNADVNSSFLRDSTIYQNQVFNGNVAQTGMVPRIAGIPVVETNVFPGTASVVGIVAHPDSVALACRYLEPINPGSYISAMRVVDDTSGIVMGYRRHYNPGRGKMFANFEVLFGMAVGLSFGLGLLTRTD